MWNKTIRGGIFSRLFFYLKQSGMPSSRPGMNSRRMPPHALCRASAELPAAVHKYGKTALRPSPHTFSGSSKREKNEPPDRLK